MNNAISAFAVGALLSAVTALPALAIEQAARDAEAPATTLQRPERQGSAQQQVSGTVQQVDRTNGLVTLASPVGALKLHFPPRFLAGMEKGDVLTAQYAFAMGDETGRAFDAPVGLGEHQMAGTVDEVNHDTGWIHVKSGETILQLVFPPHAVRDLRKGDLITIDLAFSKEPRAHRSS